MTLDDTIVRCYYIIMIKSFKCKETQTIWEGRFSKKLPSDIQRMALRRLIILDYAVTLSDIKNPPSNHLETMQSYRKGDKSIRINDQWRIVFKWNDGNCEQVEITDYH